MINMPLLSGFSEAMNKFGEVVFWILIAIAFAVLLDTLLRRKRSKGLKKKA